jgi:four helix bundle protein
MGVYRFEDLHAWRLAHELHLEVVAFTSKPPASRDRDFCQQILDSSGSAPANISEGFGRFTHRDFARFVRIAVSSLEETLNHLIKAHSSKYLTDAEFERLRRLNLRALKASRRLHAYLRNSPDPPFGPAF